MGFSAREWQLSLESFLWVLETHSPYLEALDREDLHKGAAGALGRFYQVHVMDRARSLEPAVLLADQETAELKAYWEMCKSARTQFGVVFYRSIFRRHPENVTTAAGIFQECVEHLRIATGKPNMEAVMTVFAPRRPLERWGTRFWNAQLVRYAGYEEEDGAVVGDPANVHLTKRIVGLGWTPPEPRSPFDVLPVVLEIPRPSSLSLSISPQKHPRGRDLDLSLRKESFGRLFPALAVTCADPIIRSTLRRWIHDCKAPDSGSAAAEAITAKYVTIAALLSAFPACKLSLAQAIEVLPEQKPRYYSISSGALGGDPEFVEVTVSVVRDTTAFGATRLGLCSSHLNSLRPGVDAAWISVRPSHFRAPPDLGCPILMVGPGTGLAPMMAFLADRERLLKAGANPKVGECVLFFGCRNEADFLYRDRLKAYEAQGVLSKLRGAFSRKDPAKKHYVQHAIEEDKAHVV